MKKALIFTRYEDVAGDCTKIFNGNETQTASFRLQSKPMVQALKKLGYDYNVLSMNTQTPRSLQLIKQPNIAIFTKTNTAEVMQYNLAMSNLAALARLKCRKVPIVCIYSDNLGSAKGYPTGEFHRNLLQMSDFIICPSKRLAQESHKYSHGKKPTFIIYDPWQVRQELPFKSIDKQSIIKFLVVHYQVIYNHMIL